MQEIWKNIKGFEGLYQVSNLGRVKSLPKQSGFLRRKEHILAPADNRKGYLYVDLHKRTLRKRVYIHRLVMEAFIPNPDNKPCINHKDENRSNNSLDNLEWCTYKENNVYSNISIRSGIARGNRVIQLTLDGKPIRIFNSIKEAARFYGKKDGTIRWALLKPSNTALGFKWVLES